MKTVLVILLLIVALVIMVMQQLEINDRHRFREEHSDLCDFYHFIGTCKKTEENRLYIADRILSERSLQKDEKALHLVKACEQIFNVRFNKLKK